MKTSDLIGPALDWAVLKAEGKKSVYSPFKAYAGAVNERITGWGVYLEPPERDEFGVITFEPSENWSQGGPIIEREKIETRHDGRQSWCAWVSSVGAVHGPTPLIAAMRCFVASKLGDDADVPKELL